MNQKYIDTLVNLIRKSVINLKTGLPFTVNDILPLDYRTTVGQILDS